MTRAVLWSNPAQRSLRAVPSGDQDRILSAVQRFAETGHGDVKALKGRPGFRLRVGDWRVMFAAQAEGALLILDVKRRNERTYE
jgi:mRNA interferase RelE/StbE